ncbi:hypothetical protein FK268_20730 [Tsukamurella sputi]|uniref:SWIM-type domain-containing protein n=1 Tax=Tsukamurella sputi TaxID=2591848 RepID=A0A5C5RHU8_9ACTN|nr:SWIM zinc finger family protein [Tsukamurella sputi]TWS22204.1 hypothetical protein FK268_20730 [Tsukamurella sputi]
MAVFEFGFTAFGAALVRLAEPISAKLPNKHAPRARMIARGGGVTLELDGRQVTARVHRGGSASIAHLEFAAMTPVTAAAFREALGARPEPDDAVHAAVRAAGADPAPALEAADCSCTARSTMCVHVLAALYALAVLVDNEPNTVLTLQGYGTGPGAAAPQPDGTVHDRPVPRWTPLATLDARDYFARYDRSRKASAKPTTAMIAATT